MDISLCISDQTESWISPYVTLVRLRLLSCISPDVTLIRLRLSHGYLLM